MQSVPITTEVVSSNPVHGKVYSLQHNVLELSLSVTCDKSGFLHWGSPDSFTNKTDRNDITEVLLKVVLNTITQTSPKTCLHNCLHTSTVTVNKQRFINCYCWVYWILQLSLFWKILATVLVLLMEESGAHKENCCLQLVPDKLLSHKDVLSTLIKGRN